MMDIPSEKLKKEVSRFWDRAPCGSDFSRLEPGTKAYYDQVEAFRYATEPEVISFAQFTRWHGKRVLEVGVGMGTDFVQWVKAGAKAHGIDLSPESIAHVRRRLELNGLCAEDLRVADAEALPYENDTFDLVYSWGVLHHSPDTRKALHEAVRVCRPGGTCRVMLYNRYSLSAFYVWVKHAVLAGKPWKNFSWCMENCVESPGTKAFTRGEILALLSELPVEGIRIRCVVTYWDRLDSSHKLRHLIATGIAALLRSVPVGWFWTIEFRKVV